MPALAAVAIGLTGFMVAVGVTWRLASRRRSIPCPSWLSWLVELDNPLARSNRAHTIVEHLDLQPGMRVLDLGCGPGRLTIPVARRVGPQGEVVAVDLQAGMLRRTQEKVEAAGLGNVYLVQAGAGEGRLGSEYDRVLLVTVLGEIPDREGALREIFAALKPGGLLSVTEILFDPHFQARGTVSRLAIGAGFRETGFFGNRLAFTLNLAKPE